jgi:branched-subunit amino acid aminotransferase/4-amino-4-deoxychorismate lyase
MMSNESQFVVFNGEIERSDKAVIPVDHSAIYYGTGCFETFVADSSRFFKLNEHVDRMNRGIEYLSRGAVKSLSAERIRDNLLQLLKKNDLDQETARVRVQFSLMEKGGYSISQNPDYFVLMTTSQLKRNITPIHLKTVETRVVPSNSRPSDLKLSNMLHYRNAWREANSLGADDALMLTQDDFIAETSIGNLFWKKGDAIFTPSAECDILPGITRNSLVHLFSQKDEITVQVGRFDSSDIQSADTVWMTNSVREIQEVSKIDEKTVQTDQDFMDDLSGWFNDYKMKHLL